MAVNLWPNADVEPNIDDWNISNGGVLVHSSTYAWNETYSLRLWGNGFDGYAGILSDIKSIVSESTQYTFSFYTRATDGSTPISGQVQDQDGNWLQSITVNTTTDTWVRSSATFTTGAGDTGIKILIEKNNNTDDVYFYFDAFMLETGSSASTWEDYDDYDPDLVVADADHAHATDAPAVGGIFDLVPADSDHTHAMDACDVTLSELDLVIADLDHTHATEAPAVGGIFDLVPADLAHSAAMAGGSGGGWEIGAYIFPEGSLDVTVIYGLTPADLDHTHATDVCDVLLNDIDLVIASMAHSHTASNPFITMTGGLVPENLDHTHSIDACDVSTVTGELVIASLSHTYSMGSPGIIVLGELVVADLDHTHAIDACDVSFVVAISIEVDSNGKIVLKESGEERITGNNGDVTGGDYVKIRLVKKTVSLFVNSTQIGIPYESLVLEGGTEFKVIDLGTAGAIGSVELWPARPRLPQELK